MWLWQAITGALLVILMTTHMIANHFVVEGGLRSYADVVSYLSNPVIFVWETLFLIVVTTHALMGVRAIVLDLGISLKVDRWLKWGLSALGVLMVGYGLWLTLLITSRQG